MTRWRCAHCNAPNETDPDARFCATCGAIFAAAPGSGSGPGSIGSVLGVLGGLALGLAILACEAVATVTASKMSGCFSVVGPIAGVVAVVAGLFLYAGVRDARLGSFARSRFFSTAGFVALAPTAACAAQSALRGRC